MSETFTGIVWQPWGEDAFRQADALQRPILLALTAPWCRWCHEMERTSYADPAVAALVRERFVAVRVDTDERPDINERYNLGGWPTTAFLTPDGEILSGATYLPPDRLRAALERVADAFARRRPDIEARAAAARVERLAGAPVPPAEEAGPDILSWLGERIDAAHDPEYGGFGLEPKYPHAAVLRFLLDHGRVAGANARMPMVTRALEAIAGRGLHDRVEGGFFRYATTRDWMLPHTEKLLDENAALLTVFVRAVRQLDHAPSRDAALSILAYVDVTLRQLEGGFGVSQQADDSYYALASPEDRRRATPPPIDRSLHVGPNALMIEAYVEAAETLDLPPLLETALRGLERVLLGAYRPGEGLSHTADDPRSVRGLLSDHARASSALLAAYKASDRAPYLELAQELMMSAVRLLGLGSDGALADRPMPPAGSRQGLLGEVVRPFGPNCEAARVLAALGRLGGGFGFRERAGAILSDLSSRCRDQGLAAAAFGTALLEYES